MLDKKFFLYLFLTWVDEHSGEKENNHREKFYFIPHKQTANLSHQDSGKKV